MNYGIQNRNVITNFHKGCLAGLDTTERARKQSESWRYDPTSKRLLSLPETRGVSTPHCFRPNTKATLGSSLADTLQGSTMSEIYDGSRRIELRLPTNQRKADQISFLVDYLPAAQEQFRDFAAKVDSSAFEVLLQTLSGKAVEHNRLSKEPYYVPNLVPFVFVCREDNGYASYMPPELQEAFAGIDMSHIAKQRAALLAVNKALHAYTALCGIALLEDVYCYLDSNMNRHFERTLFDECVATLTENSAETPYCLVAIDGLTYVKRHTEMSSDLRWRHQHWYSYDFGFERHKEFKSNSLSPEALVEQHRFVASRLDSCNTCDFDAGSFIYGLACVKDLSSFFDAHVPSDRDDEFFADEMVDDLIESFLFENAGLRETLRELTERGWYTCEGGNAAPQLTRLVCNLYLELPRWEFNGWSERECIDMLDAPCLISETLEVHEELDLAS